MFITIACGALSGFHSLIAPGTTPKLIQEESQVRMIGLRGELTESFVAVMAMRAACILDPGVYFAINAPAGVVGGTLEQATRTIATWGFVVTPEQMTALAASVGAAPRPRRTT